MSESEVRETESLPNTTANQELRQNQDETDAMNKAQPTRTLALIKPDAMQANNKNAIIEKIKEYGFVIVQEREIHLSKEKARLFYQEHENKPFYDELTNWMSSEPIYALVLEKQDAVQAWRDLMGPTNAIKAKETHPTSMRALFGTDGSHNATHGSDSLDNAKREIDLIFNQQEVEQTSAKEEMKSKKFVTDLSEDELITSAVPEKTTNGTTPTETDQAPKAESPQPSVSAIQSDSSQTQANQEEYNVLVEDDNSAAEEIQSATVNKELDSSDFRHVELKDSNNLTNENQAEPVSLDQQEQNKPTAEIQTSQQHNDEQKDNESTNTHRSMEHAGETAEDVVAIATNTEFQAQESTGLVQDQTGLEKEPVAQDDKVSAEKDQHVDDELEREEVVRALGEDGGNESLEEQPPKENKIESDQLLNTIDQVALDNEVHALDDKDLVEETKAHDTNNEPEDQIQENSKHKDDANLEQKNHKEVQEHNENKESISSTEESVASGSADSGSSTSSISVTKDQHLSSDNPSDTTADDVGTQSSKKIDRKVNKAVKKTSLPTTTATGVKKPLSKPKTTLASNGTKSAIENKIPSRAAATKKLSPSIHKKKEGEEENKGSATKATTKVARVPRVALLATQKKKAPEEAEGDKPVKKTIASTTRKPLTSRPAAAATTGTPSIAPRKKLNVTETKKPATIATIADKKTTSPPNSTPRKASGSRDQTASSSATRATAESKVRAPKLTRSSPESKATEATAKPKTTSRLTSSVRRASPPNSTATTNKKSATTTPVTPVKRSSKTLKTETRATNSTTKTRKETSSTTNKKPPQIKKKSTEKVKDGALEEVSEPQVSQSLDKVKEEEEEQQQQQSIEIPKEENPQEENPQEENPQEENPSAEESQGEVLGTQEESKKMNNMNEESTESTKEHQTDEEEPVHKEEEPEEVKLVDPSIVIEKDVEDTDVSSRQEDIQQNIQNSDAEIASITSHKPQMASLLSKFENLNSGSVNGSQSNQQLHNTLSKEIRAKSPNRISDMINRFS